MMSYENEGTPQDEFDPNDIESPFGPGVVESPTSPGVPIDETECPYVLGIDLGTTNSSVAVKVRNEVVLIRIDGDKSCPSVMTILDGEPVVGKRAKGRIMLDPDNVVSSVKRYMGNDQWIKVFPAQPDKEYRPLDIASEVLKKLVEVAQMTSDVDMRGNPNRVVICVPANYTDRQKQDTIEAGRRIGLKVLALLDEPVAAAICYADGRDRDQTILVYDLGGGTFDVSILKVQGTANGQVTHTVLAKAGIPNLGGDDFDMKLMEAMAAKLAEQSGIDVMDLQADAGVPRKALREAQQKLKEACERAKIELSSASSAQIEVGNIIKDESGVVHNLDATVTSAEFEEMILPLVASSRTAIESALADCKLTIEDISRIILIGGSTRVPMVRKMLTTVFGREPYMDEDPDTAVARGAAIYGARMDNPDDAQRLEINEIVTHNLGLEKGQGQFDTIIARTTPIEGGAVSFKKEYVCPRDDMTEIAIRVFQSTADVDYTNEGSVAFVDEFYLKGIPPRPRGQEKILVTFTIDSQNILRVKAESSSSSEELVVKRGR